LTQPRQILPQAHFSNLLLTAELPVNAIKNQQLGTPELEQILRDNFHYPSLERTLLTF